MTSVNGGRSYVCHHQELIKKITAQEKNFTRENIEKALSATGHKDLDAVLKWLHNHKSDPTLNEKFHRQYILFLCPTGPFLSEVSKFYEHSYKTCGGNSAHILFPHIRLSPFFEVSDALLPYILDALRDTISNLVATQPTKMHLTLQKSEGYIGLFPNESVRIWISDLVNEFNDKTENDYGVHVKTKEDQYHLALAYNFDSSKCEDLENLAKKINLDAPARWEVNIYSRDTRYTGKQFHLVLHSFTASKSDEVTLKEHNYVVVDPAPGLLKGWRKGICYETGDEGYFPENFAKKTADWRVWSKNFSVPVTQLNNSFHPGNTAQKARRSQSVNLKKEKSSNILRLSFRGTGKPNEKEKKIEDYKRPSSTEPSVRTTENDGSYTPRNSTYTPNNGRRSREDLIDEHKSKSDSNTSRHERENTINLLNQVSSVPKPWQGTSAPRRLFFMRHAERVDLTFGHDWFKMYIDEKGYHRRNLNLPRRIPTRRGGPKDFFMDGPISEVGTFQAKLIGEALHAKGVDFTEMYCSPSLRCIQTMTSVLDGLGDNQTKIKIEPALFEWMAWCRNSLPSFMTDEEYKDYGINVDLNYRSSFVLSQFNLHEKTDEYYHRSHSFVEKIARTCSGNVLMLGHSATLDVCTRQLCGNPIRKPDDLVRVVQKVPFCGLCVIEERQGGGWHLIQAPIPSLAHGQNQTFDWKILESTGSTQIPKR